MSRLTTFLVAAVLPFSASAQEVASQPSGNAVKSVHFSATHIFPGFPTFTSSVAKPSKFSFFIPVRIKWLIVHPS